LPGDKTEAEKLGATFDEDGRISNYEALLRQWAAQDNAHAESSKGSKSSDDDYEEVYDKNKEVLD